MAIVFKTGPFNYAVGSRVVKLTHIGLPNIVGGRELVREFIQGQATAENIAGEILKILLDTRYRDNMRRDLAQVRSHMGEAGCSERVARMVSELSQARIKEPLW
jgi:lipid-A-disaccharide synthase